MPLRIGPSQGVPQGLVGLQDIGAGVNRKASRFVIPPNQMRVLENFILIEDGSLFGRRGTERWNAASLGAGAILGATRAYFSGGNHFLVAYSGTIYKGDDGTKTFSSSLTGWDTSSPVWFWQYLNFVYASNKIDAPKKWDGTAWTAMGISAPGSAPSGAVGAAGTPNGTYTFKVTFVTATIESNGSAASGSVTVVNQKIDLSSIPTGPSGTTKRRIYGFKNTVSSVYQLIGEINDNVTTTFTVTTDQDSWTTAIPTDHDPPVTGPWLTVLFKNRLWKAGDPANPRRVYFSQIFIPEAWPTSFYVDVPFDQNDEVTALYVLGDLLLVFGHNAIFFIFGDTPFSFVLKKTFAVAGCPSPWAVARIENAVLYLSRHAIYAFDGAQARILSDPIEPDFTGLFEDFQSLNYAQADKATLAYYDRLKAVALSFPVGGSSTNNATRWYFLRRQGWAMDTRTMRLVLPTVGKGDSGDLYAFDAADGILRKWDTGWTDDGAAITARLKTGALTGDHPLQTKTWRWFTVRARPAAASAQITGSVDQGLETDSFAMSLTRGAVYGTGQYGTATYGAEVDDFEEAFAPDMKGRSMEIELSISYSEMVQIAQMYLAYWPLPAVRRRVGV